MNQSARSNVLRGLGVIIVVLLPVMLALWFSQLRAESETHSQLRTYARIALNKTESVIHQADLARDAAERYTGTILLARTSKADVKYYARAAVC